MKQKKRRPGQSGGKQTRDYTGKWKREGEKHLGRHIAPSRGPSLKELMKMRLGPKNFVQEKCVKGRREASWRGPRGYSEEGEIPETKIAGIERTKEAWIEGEGRREAYRGFCRGACKPVHVTTALWKRAVRRKIWLKVNCPLKESAGIGRGGKDQRGEVAAQHTRTELNDAVTNERIPSKKLGETGGNEKHEIWLTHIVAGKTRGINPSTKKQNPPRNKARQTTRRDPRTSVKPFRKNKDRGNDSETQIDDRSSGEDDAKREGKRDMKARKKSHGAGIKLND